jgi:hypothetical protein
MSTVSPDLSRSIKHFAEVQALASADMARVDA